MPTIAQDMMVAFVIGDVQWSMDKEGEQAGRLLRRLHNKIYICGQSNQNKKIIDMYNIDRHNMINGIKLGTITSKTIDITNNIDADADLRLSANHNYNK